MQKSTMLKIAFFCYRNQQNIALFPRDGCKLRIRGVEYTPGDFIPLDGVLDEGLKFGKSIILWESVEKVEPMTVVESSFDWWGLFLFALFVSVLVWLCTH